MKFTVILLLLFSFVPPFVSEAAERPNVILILVDDMGFSDLGYQGGEIETPNLDSLARNGVRFSQFTNSGRCCPTRATLMTGLHPHQTGIGWMTETTDEKGQAKDPLPAYAGNLNRDSQTIAETLKASGYATMMTGKWHLGFRDRDDWPLQRGFEKFYGCIEGGMRFFQPVEPRGMTLGNEKVGSVVSTTSEAFYTTDAFTDYAMQFITEHHKSPQKNDPFFLYLAYNAPHWPLQAFADDVAKYRGKYKMGWDQLRKARYQRQVDLGLIKESWPLSPRTPEIPAWDTLDEKKQDEMDLKMATYAAMVDRIDQNIGRLVSYLKKTETFDNTLFLFLSDNGACQEGGMFGRGEFYDVAKRDLEHNNSYGEAWANASNTPFRLYKHFAHEGGAATPFFMHWPAKIPAQKEWYLEAGQLIDLMPTILDVAGATYPVGPHVEKIPALDGVSLRPAFTGAPLGRSQPIFIEHENNAFARDGDWKLVGRDVSTAKGTDATQWELYDLGKDRTELHNLAQANPEKRDELASKWEAWAERVHVYPKAERATKRRGVAVADPPQVVGQAFTLTAMVNSKEPAGTVLSHGGVRFGYALHFVGGRPAFSFRNEGTLTELIGKEPVSGKITLAARVDEKELLLTVNGKEVARAKSPGLLTKQPGIGFYLGEDFQDPVGNYSAPNRFNGKVLSHSIDVILPNVTMRTTWGEEVTADNVWKEYPRPAMRRENWTNLNGLWNYVVTTKRVAAPPEKWEGKILVPFAIEAPLSGVEKRFTPEDALWYKREVTAKKTAGKRTLLHFEAVDYESTVWVNDIEVGSHTGGNLPFSFDITDALKDGPNTVLVRVTDATDSAYQLHGKQALNPKGIWYTPVSGIWQTVWMEEVPASYLSGLKISTRINGNVSLEVETGGVKRDLALHVSVKLGEKEIPIESVVTGKRIEIVLPDPQLWSPDTPTLYDLTVTSGDDVVESYFGIRETAIAKDSAGHLRFTLNGKLIFHWGTLDQGWWPDGLLTPPSDAAMRSDIEFLKSAGFNTIRKHIKVEPRRYYYHCDRIGMMMWQDQVSAMADNPEWTRLKPDPEEKTWPPDAHTQFLAELKGMIDHLHDHPCIVQWVPFNERWGQNQTAEIVPWIVAYDPSRQVNAASGGNWYPVGHIVDEHRYPNPGFPFELGENGRFDGYVKVVGEFGGHGFPVEGHLWNPNTKNWGYGGLPKDKAEWIERYRESIRLLADLKKQGIAGGIYTQTTDVEGEINGLLSYDRKVQKLSPDELHDIGKLLLD